jgi:hypothetical protein
MNRTIHIRFRTEGGTELRREFPLSERIEKILEVAVIETHKKEQIIDILKSE